MDRELIIVSPPHVRDSDSVTKIMWAVVFALIPAAVMSVYYFGIRSAVVIGVCIFSCIISEFIYQALRKKSFNTIFDGSALLTGLLLAYNLPANIPIWMCVLGSVFAIVVVKQLFGGLGYNIFNPALAGRAFLLISYPGQMTTWPAPNPGHIFSSVDAVTAATPLGVYKEGLAQAMPDYWQLFIGNRGGCLGEVCIAALLIGGLFLLWRKCISWHIPVSFIGTTALLGWMISGKDGLFTGDILFQILTGGIFLGAIFMATDMVTSPITKKGMLIFGIGCGILTMLIRKYGGYPEGVSFAILLMNAAVPLIDRYTRPRVYGTGKFKQGAGGVCVRVPDHRL